MCLMLIEDEDVIRTLVVGQPCEFSRRTDVAAPSLCEPPTTYHSDLSHQPSTIIACPDVDTVDYLDPLGSHSTLLTIEL